MDLLAPEQQLALRSILLLLATSVLAILLSLVLFSRLFVQFPRWSGLPSPSPVTISIRQ